MVTECQPVQVSVDPNVKNLFGLEFQPGDGRLSFGCHEKNRFLVSIFGKRSKRFRTNLGRTRTDKGTDIMTRFTLTFSESNNFNNVSKNLRHHPT